MGAATMYSAGRDVCVMRSYLDFEKPVAELEAKVEEMRALQGSGDAIAIGEEINRIEVKAGQALKELYAGLTPWQKTQVARHPQRPHCLDYIGQLITDFVPLAGDRKLRRRRRHRRRLRPLPRRERLRHRPGKGLRHRQPAQAQFRHGAAGRLPQGRAADGDGGPFRHSGDRADRYRRRLSGHRRRGARPGRGHRALDRSLPANSACPMSPSSSARAARAAPSPSPPPTAC